MMHMSPDNGVESYISVDEAARRSIHHLGDCVEALRDLVHEALSDADVQDSNHLGVMAAVFLSKQLDHAVAVLRLGEHPDTALIARSMLEGRCQLIWAAKDPAERPLAWRSSAWIADWRTMRKADDAQEPVADERRAAISRQLEIYGAQFLKPSARDTSKPLPNDPYRRAWYPGFVRDLFVATDSLELYNTLYVPFSEWHHWSAAGIGDAVHRSSDGVTYRASAPQKEATALACAFQCLLETALIADDALGLGLAERLFGLVQRYQAGTVLSSEASKPL